MGKYLTELEFIEKANKKHNGKYDYSKVKYINSRTKVCIICPEHGEFWQTPSNHLIGHGCRKCSIIEGHKKQSNNTISFIQKANEIHNNKYDYSKVEYKNNREKVCIICPKHGEFWQKPLGHIQGKGCPYCGGTKKLTNCEFIQKANEIHNNKYDYSKVEYVNFETKVCIICPEHGEFWQTPHSHISGTGCPVCFGNIKPTKEEFVEKCNEVHDNLYDYSKVEYKNSETKVCIICPEHGEFWQTPHSHISGTGCPRCNTYRNSKIVQKIENELKKLNIQFEKEKTFNWLKNKSNMYIDFFLPEYNAGIECHGIQHFKPISFFGGVYKYNEQKNRDLLKYKLCLEHGIKIYYFTNIEREYFDKIYCNEKTLIEDICKTI